MRRKSCLTFLLNSNHQINFKSKSAIRSGNIKKKEKKQYSTFSCGKGEGVFALVLPRRTTFWTITLIIILCFAAPSYFILKYSMSDFSDKFVFVRLSLQQPLDFKQILLTLFFIDSFKTSQLLFFLSSSPLPCQRRTGPPCLEQNHAPHRMAAGSLCVASTWKPWC